MGTIHGVEYHCGKCRAEGVKLWRPMHGGMQDGYRLICAACVAPGIEVDKDGKWQEPGEYGMRTDQLKGWLPAVPVDGTFWGYTSVPQADVNWWKALPTYREGYDCATLLRLAAEDEAEADSFDAKSGGQTVTGYSLRERAARLRREAGGG